MLRALRFALALGFVTSLACETLEGWLVEGLAHLDQDAELAGDVDLFGRNYVDVARGAALRRDLQRNGDCNVPLARGACLRLDLQRYGALDGLHTALWAFSRRTGAPVPHPVALAVSIERALLSQPSALQALVKVMGVIGADAATAMGMSATTTHKSWVKGSNKCDVFLIDFHLFIDFRLDFHRVSKMAFALKTEKWRFRLQSLLRARWVEGVCALSDSAPAGVCEESGLPYADSATRVAVLSFIGVGRDCSARHVSFAVPSSRALKRKFERSLPYSCL